MPNNSFKPSPLRGLGRAPYDCHSAVAAQRAGLTQALGSIQTRSQIDVPTFALAFIGLGLVVYGIDQWFVYLHFGQTLGWASILQGAVYGLGLLAAIAICSFMAGSLTSRRRTDRLRTSVTALVALSTYFAVNLALQHVGYASAMMAIVSFAGPFSLGKKPSPAA